MADNESFLSAGKLEMRARDETDAMSLKQPKQINLQLSSVGAPAIPIMLLDKL
jgi:hypothetical protein